jgi:hypothetical protein
MRRVATALALLSFLAIPQCAQAAYDPVGGGTTKLLLDKRFVSFLAEDGIKLTASAGAKRKGNTISLPVSGGNVDPTIGKGEIEQEGTIVFEGARKRVPLRDLVVKTKHSPLIAKVGGSQLKIATSPKLSSKRKGFGTAFSAKTLELSAKVATRLNKKLRPRVPFTAGQPLGSLTSNARPRLVTITESGRATLVFDPPFLAKLAGRFVSVNPIFPAEHTGGTFSFPIVVGGAIAPDGSEGTLRTGGSVELLQLDAGQVFWQELWVDLGAGSGSAEVDVEPTPAFPGKLGRIGVFGFGAITVSSSAKARTISVVGPLVLDTQTAATLNEAFAEGKESFRAGEEAGSLSFAAQGQ